MAATFIPWLQSFRKASNQSQQAYYSAKLEGIEDAEPKYLLRHPHDEPDEAAKQAVRTVVAEAGIIEQKPQQA